MAKKTSIIGRATRRKANQNNSFNTPGTWRKPAERVNSAITSVFETLETRQLMSVVNIAAYGAKANDGGDDTAAIRAAIAASQPGDTINFGAGNFNVSDKINFLGDRTYEGNGTATLTKSGGTAIITAGTVQNMTINGLTLNGGGINLDGGTNVTITNNTIENTGGGAYGDGSGVYWTNLSHSNVSWNTFNNVRGWGAIFAYGTDNTNIDHNDIINSQEGIHLSETQLNAQNDSISFNKGSGIDRAFLEIQDQYAPGNIYFNGLTIQGNYDSNHTSGWKNQGGNEFSCAYSIPLQFSKNITFANNYCDNSMAWAYECCGNNVNVTGNTLGATTAPGIFGNNIVGIDGVQSNINIHNNTFLQLSNLGPVWGLNTGTGGSQSNNTLVAVLPNVTAPAAGAFHSNGSTAPTQVVAPPSTPVTTSAPTANVAAPTNLTVSPISAAQLQLHWTDNSNGTATYEVERRATHGSAGFVELGILPLGSTGMTDSGLNASWEYDYRITAIGGTTTSSAITATGQTLITNPVVPPADGTGGTNSGGGQTSVPVVGSTPTVGSAPTVDSDPHSNPSTSPVGTGNGLLGQYFNSKNFTNLVMARTDAQVNFNWGAGSPDTAIDASTYSVRWTGQVQAPTTGQYTFSTIADDGIRVYINGKLVVNDFNDHSVHQASGKITLQAGQMYDIKVEYFENKGKSTAELFWSTPTMDKQIVPQSALFSDASTVMTTPIVGSTAGTTVGTTTEAAATVTASAPVTATNLAKGKKVTTSSNWSSATKGANAVDSSKSTRWASKGGGTQWLQIDLGADAQISGVNLHWDDGAKAYSVQVSEDGQTWQDAYSTTIGSGGTEQLNVSAQGRYVRVTATQPTVKGMNYSLWSVNVLGSKLAA